MELKKGHKQTELGPIPNDWDVKEFVEVMDGFSSGQTPYRAIPEYYKGNIPWITSGELNYNVITDTIEKITMEGAKSANLKFIPKGTFLFAITGLEAAGTRGSCAITGIEATTNQSCMALYPKEGALTTPYLYHYYLRYGNELAFKYCQGTKQQSYTAAVAKKLPIIVPPTIKEQTAIATALSDADALITSLEKLIAKKRNIKQGAMQQLLKPKKGWEVKKLGDCLTRNPDYGINAASVSYNESLPTYLRITDISEYGKYLSKDKVSVDNIASNAFYLEEGDIVFARTGASVGKTYLYDAKDGKLVFAGFLIRVKTDKTVLDPKYLFYVTQTKSYWSWVLANSMRSGQPGLNSNEYKSFQIRIPNIEVQKEIVSVLSDMDNEISVLESKLEKYLQIKSGMMQNLLTGKIRLI